MQHTSVLVARRRSIGVFSLLFVLLGLFSPMMARAQHTSLECPPQTGTVISGGSVTINISDCEAVSGSGGNGAIDGGAFGAADFENHGTATTRHTSGQWFLDYSHNGSTGIGSTDVFELSDGSLAGTGDIRFTITINASTSPITVAPASLPTLTAGTPFSQTLASSGGLAPYTYTLQGGALPAGLSLSSGGVLSGTPTQRGAYSFSVRATDATTPTAQFADKGYTGTVQNPTLSLIPTSATAIQSVPFSRTFSASGGVAPYTFLEESIIGGYTGLPAGITFSGSGVSGTTAAAPGNYNTRIRITDSSTGPGSWFEVRDFILTVSPPPSVSIAVAPASAGEDSGTNLVYTVTRSLNLTSPTAVNITTSGTATAGTDYSGNVANVTIPSGATTATITIDPTTDGTLEADETVTLTVAAGTGYTVGTPASATGTIANDDLAVPTLTLTKISQGGVGAFTFTGTNGWSSQTITTTSSGVGVSGATQTLSAAGVVTTVTESLPPGYALVSASCTGMGGGGTATLTGNTLTLSAAATAAGANIACTFTNVRLPTLTLTKISQGGVGAFVFTGNNGWISQAITTTTSGVGVSGATQTLVVAGVVTTISEAVPAGYALTAVSCTGMGSGGTAVMAGSSVTLDAAATAAGANISCTFTNRKLPTLTLTKISQGGVGAFTFTGTNGWTSQTITTTSSGVGVSGATQTLLTAGVVTTVTESLPPSYALASASCTGMGGGGTATLSGNTLTLSAAATAAGANIACTFTNVRLPTLTLTKISNGRAGTFTFVGTNGWASQSITTTTPGIGVTGATQTLASSSTSTSITENAVSGFLLAGVTCTGMGPGGTASLSGNTLTLNSVATAAGANIVCTFTNNDNLTDAVNDAYGPLNGASGATTPSVLLNDTLGGNPATVGAGGNVALTPGLAPTPPAGNIAMNADGTITVAPGTTAGSYSYPYSLCEVADPTNCDTATATLAVSAAPIDAVDDAGTVPNGAVGGVAVPNVLGNDTRNGAPATLAVVTLTQSSTSHPDVTLNLGTGAVEAAPGTPAGTHTLVYAICEILNPTNCDSAAVVVTVIDAPPVASNSALTVAYNAPATNVPLNLSGGAPTSLAITTPPIHGSAIVSGLTITYQPTSGYAGPDSFSYTASNAGGTSAAATVSVTVQDPAITITPSGGFAATVASPYAQTFSFNGGATPWSGYQVTNLPAGLSVTGTTATTVTVSGTPTAAGTFNLNVSATDSSTGNGPYTIGQAFALTVAGPTLTLAPAAGTLSATYAAPYSQAFTAAGGVGPYSYAVAGPLPAGLSLSGGTIAGTATAPGSYPITVTATDTGATGTGAPFTAAQSYTISVPAPTIDLSPTALPNGTAGTAYNQALGGSGGIGPYVFTVSAGSLPPGLMLSSAGVLSGMPTSAGTFNLTVTATDANGQPGSRAYTLVIAVPTLTLLPAALPGGVNGMPYSQAFTAAGGVAPYAYALTGGTLPTGLSLSGAGVLSGTPAQFGNFSITVTATDSTGGTAATISRTYALTVSPVIVLSAAGVPSGIMGVSYNGLLAASGGAAPYSFALTGGSLPPGLAMSANGAITGTPGNVGSWTFTVTTTDSQGFTGTAQVTIAVATPYTPVPVMDRWALALMALLLMSAARWVMPRND